MAGETINTFTVANARSADANTVGQVWASAVIRQSRLSDALSEMEGGERSQRPILVKQELKAGRGEKVHYSLAKVLGGSARRGTDALEGYEEKPALGTFYVTVDQVRHGIGWSDLITHLLGCGYSLEQAFGILCAEHFGRLKQNDALMSFRRYNTALNTIRPNGRTTLDTITQNDTIDTTTIGEAASMLATLGGQPANLSKSKAGAEVWGYTLFAPDQFLRPLKADSDYKEALRHAATKGDKNILFSGGYADWDGHIIKHWYQPDMDTYGPIGSPLLPKAKLGYAITGGTSAIDVKAPGTLLNDTGNGIYYYHPFQFFKGYSYKLLSHDAPDADTNTYYFVVYNITGADAGKYGVYSYVGSSGNLGYQIGITNRLASSASGAAVTTLAGQTWDGGVHTDAHPVGSLIIPVNALCVPYGWGLMLGAGALLRCYGSVPMRAIKMDRDYGEKRGSGYRAIYGQKPAVDTSGQPVGYVLVEGAVDHQGVTLTYA